MIWFPLGRWELRKLLEAGHKEELMQYQYKILKYLEEVVEENRRKTGVYHLVLLGDSAELTFWKLAHYESKFPVIRVRIGQRTDFTFVSCSGSNDPSVFPGIRSLLSGVSPCCVLRQQ